MKAITKFGLALILFITTAVFNNAKAQKFEFKSTKAEKYEHRSGKDFGNKDTFEIENNFILDFDNKKWWNESDKVMIDITTDVEKVTKRGGEKLYMFYFVMNDMKFFANITMYKGKEKSDLLEFSYDFFPEGAQYPSYELKLTYTGKATELKK